MLDAALTLFAEKGFAATRAEEVARRAGVSKGTLYLYYPSKAELFKAVVRGTLSHLIAEGQEAVDQYRGSSSALLADMMSAWWERVGSTPVASIHKIVLAEVRNFPELAQFYADEVIGPAERLFRSAVQRGIERGEFRPLPLHAAAHVLMAPMMIAALHQHSIGACGVKGLEPPAPHALLRTHLDLVLHGLEAHPERARTAAAARAPGRSQAPVPQRTAQRPDR